MKKVISFMMAVLLIGGLCSVWAADTTADTSGANANGSSVTAPKDKCQHFGTKAGQPKVELQGFAAKAGKFAGRGLCQNGQAICDNTESNLELAKEIRQLRSDLAAKLKTLKDSGSQLPQSITDRMTAYKTQLTELNQKMKDTQGQIKDAMKEYRDSKKDGNSDAAATALAKIEAIQKNRSDILTQKKGILQSMNTLIDGYNTASTQITQ